MRKKGLCKRLQHSGSTTEGLKVNDKMEFDVMIIARGENLKITNVEGHPGYVHLTIKEESKGYKKNTLQRYIDNSTYLSPSIFMQKIFKKIKAILEEEDLEEFEGDTGTQVIVKKHGPSICLTFTTENGTFLFQADIVPTIEIIRNGKSVNTILIQKIALSPVLKGFLIF